MGVIKKMKTSFIGLGGAGGQLLKQVDGKRINTLEINCTYEDINDISKNILVVGNTGGTDRNREEAKNIIEQNIMVIGQSLLDVCKGTDIAIVVSSSGGGFGSGANIEINRLLNKLAVMEGMPEIIISVMYVPEKDEGQVYFVNHYNNMNEFSDSDLTYSYIKDRSEVLQNFLDINKTRINIEGTSHFDSMEKNTVFGTKGLLTVFKDDKTDFVSNETIAINEAYIGIGTTREEMKEKMEDSKAPNKVEVIYKKHFSDKRKEYIVQSGSVIPESYFEAIKEIANKKGAVEDSIKDKNDELSKTTRNNLKVSFSTGKKKFEKKGGNLEEILGIKLDTKKNKKVPLLGEVDKKDEKKGLLLDGKI